MQEKPPYIQLYESGMPKFSFLSGLNRPDPEVFMAPFKPLQVTN